MRVLPAFPSGVRGFRGCVVRFPTIARACHAACDAHLVPTLRALHHRVPRNTRFPLADFFLLMNHKTSEKRKNGPKQTTHPATSMHRTFAQDTAPCLGPFASAQSDSQYP
jgi:hypothetical protein